jgi:D-alanyl-lipoteichoic acid acyltransferase DltB (MBOAT superfamily)
MLHFGSFHLLSCWWRSYGVDARAIMNQPTRSKSITEFWSNRWNTAFRDFTHEFVFGPLSRQWGLTAALVIGFVFSGVVHDIVISLPAVGGYGGPTLFFVLQCVAILLERSRAGKQLRLGRGWCGRLFAVVVLLVPVRLLFHDRFVLSVVLPFMQALGAA